MNEIATNSNQQIEKIVSQIALTGNLAGLSVMDKMTYYGEYCKRIGLDPVTLPFKLISLQGKEVLYCDRGGCAQLNRLHRVSHQIISRGHINDIYMVTVRATLPDGRYTDSIGVVTIGKLVGDNLSNAIMKAETKAKRRATLDLLGLGVLSEDEIGTIKDAVRIPLPGEPEPVNPILPPPEKKPVAFLTEDQRTEINSLFSKVPADLVERVYLHYKVDSTAFFPASAYDAIKRRLTEEINKNEAK